MTDLSTELLSPARTEGWPQSRVERAQGLLVRIRRQVARRNSGYAVLVLASVTAVLMYLLDLGAGVTLRFGSALVASQIGYGAYLVWTGNRSMVDARADFFNLIEEPPPARWMGSPLFGNVFSLAAMIVSAAFIFSASHGSRSWGYKDIPSSAFAFGQDAGPAVDAGPADSTVDATADGRDDEPDAGEDSGLLDVRAAVAAAPRRLRVMLDLRRTLEGVPLAVRRCRGRIHGECYAEGVRVLSTNREAGIDLLIASCDAGRPFACWRAATEIAEDRTEDRRIVRLLARACRGSYARACTRLGQRLANGSGIPHDDDLALAFLERGHDLGDPVATFGIARRYYYGDGVRRDRSKGVHFFELACAAGDAQSCDGVGLAYRWRSPIQDLQVSFDAYVKACRLGFMPACERALGFLNSTDPGVEISSADEAHLREWEAEQPDTP